MSSGNIGRGGGLLSNVETHNGGAGDNILPVCRICSRGATSSEVGLSVGWAARPPGTPDRPFRPPDKGQKGIDWLSRVIMIYLVHVGCYLVTTCLPHHWINERGRDWRMNIGRHGRYGHINADGRKHVGRQHVPGANMYRAWTCWVPTCTGCKHVGRQHVLGANMSGANLKAPT
jgi:hypothetical protein